MSTALAVLEEFAAAWKALDGERIGATLELSAVVIGTDPGEYTIGRDSYVAGWRRGGYPTAAASFDWEAEPIVVVEGAAAWSHGVIGFDLVVGDGTRVSGRMWISAALRRTDEWRIAQLHASYAEPPRVR